MNRREISLALFVVGCGSALLFKATEPHRQEKRRSNCYHNLKSIGMAIMLYSQDNNDTFPLPFQGHGTGPSDGRTKYKWMDAISPYIASTEIFTCPDDDVNPPYQRRSGKNYGSYVMNNTYFLPNDSQTPPAGIRRNQLVDAASTVLITEGEGNFQVAWPDARRTPPLTGDNPFHLDSMRGRHGSGIHKSILALGCDGSTSTAVAHPIRQTSIIGGRQIYTAFTIEDDGRRFTAIGISPDR